ncbi:MAG: hypothetical protein LBD51_08430 [Bifidobacteriaceae bacterium]|jgi:predicted metal-dependent HD superfamily phosphohydrolase|nr:hypothetical protein [Bifidobacteriaceae bacterium]
MGGTACPDWLLGVWSRALFEAGSPAEAGEVGRIGAKLLDRWSNPGRVFHGPAHLISVLEKVDELSQEASCPCLVRLAAFYHGAMLSTDILELGRHTWGEDEARSAELALGQLTHLGLAGAKAARVRDLVAQLGARPPQVKDPDLAVLCDAERAILAADPRSYRLYAAQVRDECGDAPAETVLEVRIQVLRRWLAKDRLFLCSATASWEDIARNNVEAELARCLPELAALRAAAGSPPGPAAAAPPGRGAVAAAAPPGLAEAAPLTPAPAGPGLAGRYPQAVFFSRPRVQPSP